MKQTSIQLLYDNINEFKAKYLLKWIIIFFKTSNRKHLKNVTLSSPGIKMHTTLSFLAVSLKITIFQDWFIAFWTYFKEIWWKSNFCRWNVNIIFFLSNYNKLRKYLLLFKVTKILNCPLIVYTKISAKFYLKLNLKWNIFMNFKFE